MRKSGIDERQIPECFIKYGSLFLQACESTKHQRCGARAPARVGRAAAGPATHSNALGRRHTLVNSEIYYLFDTLDLCRQ
ncbi:hypothetical protein EVAR_29203_1 [Eumeta japonica]|uniref:Uncharacterized protein n=1 Tax=Eumeta variegata TaxID=151549 RepID=A0A4C1VI49_EUMVA|nr:hypothetical protein EVAR_29203_1 [Eumeta japonica]